MKRAPYARYGRANWLQEVQDPSRAKTDELRVKARQDRQPLESAPDVLDLDIAGDRFQSVMERIVQTSGKDKSLISGVLHES
jgi:hypothetical protein